MTQDFFHGFALNAVDAKSRLSIPAAFREVVERRSDARSIVLAPHERARCLVGYDKNRAVRLQGQLETRFDGQYDDSRDDFARLTFGLTENVPYDANGRIILSPIMKEFGEIDGLAFFLAAGDYFEVWNPQVYLAERAERDPRGARLVKLLLTQRGEGA